MVRTHRFMKLGLLFSSALSIALLSGCGDADHPGYFVDESGTSPTANGTSTSSSSGGVSSSGGSPSSSSSSSSGGAGSGDGGGGASGSAAPCTQGTKSYGTMKTWACIPSNMPAKAGLVVALHGYTQGVESAGTGGATWGFKPTSQWEALAEQHKFYVLYADHGTSAFQWYAFFGTSGIARTDLEPTNIAQMVKDFIASHDVDPNKVFVNGLSAGAYMTTVMLATYPDVFAGGSMFEGGAYGCSTSCAALGKKGKGWTWPGNHAASLVTQAYPTVWSDANARKPKLLVFQGDADGAVTPENLADVTTQWSGALGITGAGTTSTLKGHAYTEYSKNGTPMLATILMKGIGHGTPVDPGTGPDQGGWDPEPSQTMKDDSNITQDWTNSAGIYGPYYSAKFWGLIP